MITQIYIDKLICHERINRKRLEKIMTDIQKNKVLRKPVVVDRETMVILDGHHRYHALKQLGAKKIYCQIVNYFDTRIRVNFRRPDIRNRLIKEIILENVLSGNIFPYKTTRHILPERPVINKKIELG